MLRVVDLVRGDPPPRPARAALDAAVAARVRGICARVRAEGDAAVEAFTEELDGARVAGRLLVHESEVEAGASRVPRELRRAIEGMAARLRDLHRRQAPSSWEAEEDGLRFGEAVRPLASVGCYAPGGRAAYPSTVLAAALPARVAGVPRVVLCTPPAADGSVADAVLYAARVAGVDAVFRAGGAQAVAAMAYGTETIPAVDKIVGPGSVWVTAAKREVAGEVGIDGLAGPTELVVVADESADPALLAVDLVAQAEHDPLARATLVTPEAALPGEVGAALEVEVEASPRRAVVEAAIGEAMAVVVSDLRQAADVVDRLAPEHLQIVLVDARGFLGRVRAYGAAFLGPATPVSLGDYGVGSNHVLPTMARARFESGLRTADFVTVSSWVEASPEAVARLGPEVEALALAEGLPGHARACRVRR